MDRNNMRSSYVNSGPRSLPHMTGSKRHNGNGHGNAHNGNHNANGYGNAHNGSSHSGNGHSGARLSPPMQLPQVSTHNNNNNNSNQHDDLINYIYDSWNKVTRELERGSEDAKYYQDMMEPRQLANFRPFNLEQWWGRRFMQTINRKNRS